MPRCFVRSEDLVRLRHMLDAAKDALSFAQDRRRSELEGNKLLLFALVKAIEIIGEAASKLTPECKDGIPDIPWGAVITMRHRLIHAYADINRDTVWNTIQEDLPPLIQVLDGYLAGSEKNS